MKVYYLYFKATRYSFHITASLDNKSPRGYSPLCLTRGNTKLQAIIDSLPDHWKPPAQIEANQLRF